MKSFDLIKKMAVPGIAITALASVSVLTAQPAQAGSLGQDLAVGAGVGIVTGVILGNGVGIDNAANGAAAGAAVHVADEELRRNENRNIIQDVGVGAVTSGAVGEVTNDDGFLENAAQGAATGAIIHILD
jgi:hypothetical protein